MISSFAKIYIKGEAGLIDIACLPSDFLIDARLL